MNQTEVNECLRYLNPVVAEPPAPAIAPLLARLDTTVRSFQEPVAREHPRRRAPRRRSLALIAGVAGLLAVGVFVFLGASGRGTQNVLAAAFRASTPGPGVLHALVVSENTVAGQTDTTREELWTAQSPRRLRSIITIGGEVTESALTTSPLKELRWSASAPQTIQQSTPAGVLESEQSPVSLLREAYVKGELTVVGQTSLDGRAVWQLSVHPSTPPATLNGQQLPDPTVLVDANTFVPVENVIDSVSEAGGQPELDVTRVHYLTYEELPANPQSEALLQLAEHPGATERSE
jgi:hypothetical protein